MLGSLFKDHRNRRCRQKRPRGIIRRANRILKKGREFASEPPYESDFWSNYGHVHLDWNGDGDYGPMIKAITLEAHALVFRAMATRAKGLDKPFQLFLSLWIADAGQDAVYIHTPNPDTPFPIEWEGIEWGVPELENWLSRVLPEFDFVVGKSRAHYVAWAKQVGVPLCTS